MDIAELRQITTAEAHQRAFLKDLTDAFAHFTKPIIAAVVGFAVSNTPDLTGYRGKADPVTPAWWRMRDSAGSK
jgi:hypothetical protein